jgi:predicted metal-binding membrane protein
MPPAVMMFGLGYTIVWVAFSAGAALAQWMLHQTAMLTPAMAASSGASGRQDPRRRRARIC